jgi:hypothetical protein
MRSASSKRPLGVAVWRHLWPTESWLAAEWPSNRTGGCQRTPPAGYPATKGSPGGKLPAGNGALRSPAFNFSAAVLKSETNQE